MALSGALTFSELSAMMPRAGGVYVFLTEAYGSLTGFLFGWAYFLVVNGGGLGASAWRSPPTSPTSFHSAR